MMKGSHDEHQTLHQLWRNGAGTPGGKSLKMSDVIVVAGARPNFMKVAPVLAAGKEAGGFRWLLVHTGQHYDAAMSSVFFEELGMPQPDVYLGVGSGTHGAQTGKVLIDFERYLLDREEAPAGVVVVGDVNSTLACALASVKLEIPVAHVEAGLRSRDRSMPEEINRVMTDAISDLCFVTEDEGVTNLRGEGVPSDRIHLVGNTMIDTLFRQLERARGIAAWRRFDLEERGYGLVTLHRPSNVDSKEKLTALLEGLARISEKLPLVFPIHPRTSGRVQDFGLDALLQKAPGIKLCAPLGYVDNLSMMQGAAVVITDSGGVQEETTALGVPCLTMRENTERPATITHGTNTLVGGDLAELERLVTSVRNGTYKRAPGVPLWDGKAAGRIVEILRSRWSQSA
jgi:UDP-N-acetylglucosamine 2-epimerase (non-hydrolysing)